MKSVIFSDALEKQRNCMADYSKVFEMIDEMVKTAWNVKNNGLLHAEDTISKYMDEADASVNKIELGHEAYKLKGVDRLLVLMLKLIVDGESAETVSEIGEARYFSSALKGRDALAGCMVYEGCLAIMKEEHPLVIKKRLLAMLPEHVADQYMEKAANEEADAAPEKPEASNVEDDSDMISPIPKITF